MQVELAASDDDDDDFLKRKKIVGERVSETIDLRTRSSKDLRPVVRLGWVSWSVGLMLRVS